MSRIALSNAGSWNLKFPHEQDIRGHDALDANGNKVGVVDTMIVNTDERRVDAILLDDGTEYPARDLSIGDGVVYLTSLAGDNDLEASVTVYDDMGHVVEREVVGEPDYDSHRDAFRTHHAGTYGAAGRTFDADEDAYRYGYESAYNDSYRDTFRTHHADTYGTAGRTFDADEDAYRYGYESAYSDSYRDSAFTDVENDLRTGYGTAYAGRDYDADRDAIRYGYGTAQRGLR